MTLQRMPRRDISRLLQEGKTVVQIADLMNSSACTVYRMIREYDLRVPQKLLLPEAELRQLLSQGRSVSEIAEEAGCSDNHVYKRLHALGLSNPRTRAYQHVPHGRDLMREIQKGATIAELAEKYDVVEVTVRNRIKKAGWRYDRATGWSRRDDLHFNGLARLTQSAHMPIPNEDR